MEYIKKITIQHGPGQLEKIKGKEIEFLPGLNFLVGENGIGKSSLINAIPSEQSNIKIESTGAVRTFTFDAEKMSPRISNLCEPGVIRSRFVSHGEALLPCIEYIKNIPEENKEDSFLILLDEPEAGQSPWNQKKLRTLFETLSDKMQFIIATHSLVFTHSKIGRVIELNKKSINYYDPPNTFNWKVL